MFITRTPLRVSFLGGGSDYKEFFQDIPGYVLGTTVDLYVYVSVIQHSSLADSKFRLSYRLNEDVESIGDFKHPVVREILKAHYSNPVGLHIATQADVPARTGLGSSSAFTVGLLHAIQRLNKIDIDMDYLAKESVRIERVILNESGGYQDQYHAAHGGLALYRFDSHGVTRRQLNNSEFLDKSMILVGIGAPRDSVEFANKIKERVTSNTGKTLATELSILAKYTSSALESSNSDPEKRALLSEAMNEAWKLKQNLSQELLNPSVIEVIELAMNNGASAAKLCGAGGSGFVLVMCEPTNLENLMKTFIDYPVREISSIPHGTQSGPISWEDQAIFKSSW